MKDWCIKMNGLVARVWNLHLMHYERSAWIDWVLRQPEKPDVNAYFSINSMLEGIASASGCTVKIAKAAQALKETLGSLL